MSFNMDCPSCESPRVAADHYHIVLFYGRIVSFCRTTDHTLSLITHTIVDYENTLEHYSDERQLNYEYR